MATRAKERELTPLEQEVLAVTVKGNASLDLFHRHPRPAIESAIKVLCNLHMIRMGARSYYIPTRKGRRVWWASVVALDAPEFLVRVQALRGEAVVAGDSDQVDVCDAALLGSMTARMECARVLRDAEAQS